MMKAAVFCRTARSGVKVSEQVRPTLTNDPNTSKVAITPNCPWVVVKVTAVGLNPVDAKKLYGDKLPPFFLGLVERIVEGWRVGIDFSGVVTECDKEATTRFDITVGDEVFGTSSAFMGSCAEVVRIPADQICKKPSKLSLIDCSALALGGLTCLQAFHAHKLSQGHHILVIGASGGTGHLAVQIAKAKGAGKVTAICGGRNREFVASLGADVIVDYNQSSDDLLKELQNSVTSYAATGGSSYFDLVFDTVSSHDERDSVWEYESKIRNVTEPAIFNENFSKYIFIGGQVGDWFLAHLHRFFGVNWFAKGRQLSWVRFPASHFELLELSKMVDEDKLKLHISQRLNFTEENVQQAFENLLSRRTTGKIIIDLTNSSSSSS